MTMRTRVAAGIAALAVVAAAGLGFWAGRSSGSGHGSDGGALMLTASAGEAGGHGAHMGAGPEWDGPAAQMGAMPGVELRGSRLVMAEDAFLAMMIPHHRMAVDMAGVVLERGSDPRVRAIARAVVDAQEDEIGLMRVLHRERFGTLPPQVPMSGAVMSLGMSMDMAQLEDAADVDREFLRMMLPHHAGAILMADMVLAGDPSPEVAELAGGIIDAQSDEMGRMQALRG